MADSDPENGSTAKKSVTHNWATLSRFQIGFGSLCHPFYDARGRCIHLDLMLLSPHLNKMQEGNVIHLLLCLIFHLRIHAMP